MDEKKIAELQDAVAATIDASIENVIGKEGAYAAVVMYKPEAMDGANVVATGRHITKAAGDTTALLADLMVRMMQDPDFEDRVRELVDLRYGETNA